MNNPITEVCKVHGLTAHFSDAQHTLRCKKCRSAAVHKRRKEMRIKGIQLLGGACSNCGYNKCMNALHFHHRNPAEKEFGLSVRGMTRSWDKYKAELDKCELLCANCHAETHAELYEAYDLDQDLTDRTLALKDCKNCSKEFKPKASRILYCSPECSSFSRRRCTRPSREELKDLVWKYPFTKLGKMFNVSDVSIRKWCKYYEITDLPPRGYYN